MINEVMTIGEAAKIWGVDIKLIRNEITRKGYIKTKKIQKDIDYRKSGNIYLISRSAMCKLFGESK